MCLTLPDITSELCLVLPVLPVSCALFYLLLPGSCALFGLFFGYSDVVINAISLLQKIIYRQFLKVEHINKSDLNPHLPPMTPQQISIDSYLLAPPIDM